MRIGSLFSGIGGLDLAAEAAFSARTIWHCEIDAHARKVLQARWPDAVLHDDVRTLTADTAEPIDVLTGGFPCQDLSVAGKRAGLDGARSGLYGEMLRIAGELRPTWIVFENVPPLLRYRPRVEADLERMGYGSIWQVCEASDVGAPHRRQRVFVVARRGMCAHVMLPRPSAQRDLFVPAFGGAAADGLWPTPTVKGGYNKSRLSGKAGDGLDTAVKVWPTPTTHDCATMYAQGGEPLGHAARWPTPMAADGMRANETYHAGNATLLGAARWPTPAARDYRDSGHEPSAQRRKSPCLPASAVMAQDQANGVLNPAWVELLMGLPPGWTDPDCDQLGAHRWPAGRGETQHPGEPPRLVPAKSVANRRARLKALGNAVVWQQARAALERAKKVVERC